RILIEGHSCGSRNSNSQVFFFRTVVPAQDMNLVFVQIRKQLLQSGTVLVFENKSSKKFFISTYIYSGFMISGNLPVITSGSYFVFYAANFGRISFAWNIVEIFGRIISIFSFNKLIQRFR